MIENTIHRIFLLLGGNKGDRKGMLGKAKKLISVRIGEIQLVSSIYETEPWGFTADLNFLNQAIGVITHLSPQDLMNEIIEIEKILGRKREAGGYHSRTMDIDILFYDDIVLESDNLVIPHPRLQERRFVLVPLREIANDFIHPVMKVSIGTLFMNCKDYSMVRLFSEQACLPEVGSSQKITDEDHV